jgi:glycosyltransferase involved in cell wall biosynthesis
MTHISIAIPTYEMHGKGALFLAESFEALLSQSFKDFDVVISDNATTDVIKKVCDEYSSKLTIHYFKNDDAEKRMSSNVNNAIRHSTGKIVKVLFLDDILYGNDALKKIAENFDLEKDTWLVTGCTHTKNGTSFFREHAPLYNDNIHVGKNTIGSPSVLAIKNGLPLQFDPKLSWLMDCDYYKQCYDMYGSPKIINDVCVAIRIGEHQITSLLPSTIKAQEKLLMKEKYAGGPNFPIDLSSVTVVAVSSIDPVGAINALQLSMKNITYHDAVLISHNKPENLPAGITFKKCKDTELVSKDPKNKDDYSKFMAYNLCDYIDSEYCLIVHNDAYVLHPEKWDKAFFKYDYLGAPWPKNLHYTNEGVNVRVGNGGFSLRSKRMLNILNDLNLPFTDNGTGFYNEDGIMCVYYRKQLEDAGIKFASVELAARFSHEFDCEESVPSPFGFHNFKTTSRYKLFKDALRLLKRYL